MSRLWTRFLVIALLISGAMNVALFLAAKDFYTREAKFRLSPVGIPSFKSIGSEQASPMLLLGDSRIANWPEVPLEHFRTINGGVGNETTAQIRLRTNSALVTFKPSVVVIQAGINDLKVIPLTPLKKQAIVDSCVTNLKGMAEMALEAGSKVLILSVWPAGRVNLTRRLVWSGDVEETVNEVNRQLSQSFQGDRRVGYLDLSEQIDKDRHYLDTLHFKPDFYSLISAKIDSRAIELITSEDVLKNSPSKP
jgi:lysophospholipase L1-like esterase